MPYAKCLMIALVAAGAASPVLAESGRTQRDVALQALQLSNEIVVNSARKSSVPGGLPPGVYPSREREGRVVCTRERVRAFDSTDPTHVEIVTVCTR